jgi:hypothetical protein
VPFIESSLLHGEPISETVKLWSLYASFFIFPSFSTLILLWLGTVVDDELIFDLDTGTLIRLVRSRFSRLFKRPGSVKKRLRLSRYSKVSIRFDSELDSDGDTFYFYSLEISGDSPSDNFEIDRLYHSCFYSSSSVGQLFQKSILPDPQRIS